MTTIPSLYQDMDNMLTKQGFMTSHTWYHGTTSTLGEAILSNGLKQSGDKTMRQVNERTMATIGADYTAPREPIFLTPSKSLAYYWAERKKYIRRVRLGLEEKPVVIQLNLSDELSQKVKPDVGATSFLLMEEGEQYMSFLSTLYEVKGLGQPTANPAELDRLDYLTKLGFAYIDADIAPQSLCLLES
ncbi:MAG: hypothetical protein MJA28_10280 [Gammaproteobacteria bacterium]|nr:hypothetical protein [Gammaproteobacteria bacterium]